MIGNQYRRPQPFYEVADPRETVTVDALIRIEQSTVVVYHWNDRPDERFVKAQSDFENWVGPRVG